MSARKPDWLRVRAPGGPSYAHLKQVLRSRNLYTVCEEAHCPNVGECWGGGTATFMVLGEVCTRGCRFCAVTSGNPGGGVDEKEPENVAAAAAEMGLEYVVLTMVDRDDLPDGGAGHVASCIAAIKERSPGIIVEALVSDFRGDQEAIDTICSGRPDVYSHNVETVERLQDAVRDRRCSYEQSLEVLARAKAHSLSPYTKSSIMLGLGETEDELVATMRDLRRHGVDFLTLGQYLQPSHRHLAVRNFVSPQQFEKLQSLAESLGFSYVAAGPLVRSSYRAGEFFVRSLVRGRQDDEPARGNASAESSGQRVSLGGGK
jgi:lipoic acid synthetase